MRFCLLIVLLLPIILMAQNPIKLSIETRSGYEYNAFNGNKMKAILDEDGNSLISIRSGFYQRWAVRGSWKKKLKAHTLGFSAKASKDEFWALKSANSFRSDYQFSYTYKVKKNTFWYYKAQFSTYRTNRIANATEVISIPSAYKRLGSNLGYKFRPHKKHKTQIEVTALQKTFQADNDRQLSYFDFGLELTSTQKFKKKSKPASYLTLSLGIHQRNYVDRPTDDFWDLDELGEETIDFDSLNEYRTWVFQTLKLDYTFKVNEALKITSGIALQQRLDIIEAQFGYRQWQPFTTIVWEINKLKLHWKLSSTFRTFSQLKADEHDLFALKHQYLRSALLATYPLNDSWLLSAQFNLRKRWRNQPPDATNNYLSYLNARISIGIKYKF